jgi:predicted outer membrane lipoprotein
MDFQKLQKRVVGILTDPIHEWRMIAAEQDDVESLYKGYILPLAAIPAVSMFLGLGIIGAPFAGRFGIVTALTSAIWIYGTNLALPILGAMVVEKLAPRFRSSGTLIDALKLVAYASTPMWVAGVLYLLLYIAPLVLIAGLYSVYLLYSGLPAMMKTHPDQAVPYTVVTVIAMLVIGIVLSAIRAVLGLPSYGF